MNSASTFNVLLHGDIETVHDLLLHHDLDTEHRMAALTNVAGRLAELEKRIKALESKQKMQWVHINQS